MRPKQERKPCCGWGLEARMVSTTRAVAGSVAKFDFWGKSKNWVPGIQWLRDSQTLEKATLRQNPFEALGGVPEVVVPDNLKAAVTRTHRYEPDLNRTYLDLASHYHVAIIPARAARPRDKAKVEVGVQVVERWILARLRHHTFFALAEVNAAIRTLLPDLNARPFKKLPGSRQSLFAALDQPALRPLPAQSYEYAEWKRVRVNIDYHVEVDGHYYSVPYALVKPQLEVRLTAQVVEVFYHGKRLASHPRVFLKGRHSTIAAHMPTAHRHYVEWTPQRLIRWAATSGEATGFCRKVAFSRVWESLSH